MATRSECLSTVELSNALDNLLSKIQLDNQAVVTNITTTLAPHTHEHSVKAVLIYLAL